MGKAEETEQPKKEEQQGVDFHAPDYLLQHLVLCANDGMSMGITLCVNGAVVTGTLIGGDHYFALMKEAVAGANGNFDSDVREGFGEMFDRYAKIYAEPPANPPLPMFVHVKDAKIFVPGQPPMPTSGMLWRGRLSAVSGFTLGSMTLA